MSVINLMYVYKGEKHMKIAIIFKSIHQGNTKKVLEGVKGAVDVDLIPVEEVGNKKLDEYDMIGLASGIYMGKCHEQIRKFIDENKVLASGKKVFLLLTCGAIGKKYGEEEKKQLASKGCKVLGIYKCKGYDTYGIYKYIGGIAKEHPNNDDIRNAIQFVKSLQ